MPIHDIILGACQWVFVLALIFSLGRDRLWITAPITALGLTVMAVTLGTMAFWHSMAACAVAALCWYVIASRAVCRRFKRRRDPESVKFGRIRVSRSGFSIGKDEPWAC